MDYLVTGAAGQLGRVVVAAAGRRGLEVEGGDVPGLGVREAPVDDREAVMAWLKERRPRGVLHCGAWTDVDGCELDPQKAQRINGEGTANVVAACLEVGARLVYVSTDFVFDGAATAPIPVDAEPRPISHYGRSKLAGETAVLAAGADGFHVVRTAWVFGPGGKNFPRAILNRAQAGHDLTVVDDQVGRPTYTVDLAEALLDVAESAAPTGIFHASNEGVCSWFQFACDIVREAGLPVKVAPIKSDQLADRPAPRPAYSVLDTGKLAALRGKPLPHYLEALRAYLREELK